MPYDGSEPLGDLLDHLATRPLGGDRFAADAPDWFGDRVFGGLLIGVALDAACRTVEATELRPHSLHAYFLGPVRPGPLEVTVERTRDGRTLTNRSVSIRQDDRSRLSAAVSFHGAETGDTYQVPTPDAPSPESLSSGEDAPPGLEIRWIGPTERREDGTYRSTRRCWERTTSTVPDRDEVHHAVAAFLSDMTGTSFRPHSLDEWGSHTDASIDHAVWFHRPPRVDEWLYADFHALVNAEGRSTVRGELFDRAGRLVLSMAQELLIRPLDQQR